MRRSRPWLWAALLLTLLGLAPMLAGMIAQALADHAGCHADAGFREVCMLGGRDIGGLINQLIVFVWFMVFTIWLLPLALIAWIVWLVLALRAPAPMMPARGSRR